MKKCIYLLFIPIVAFILQCGKTDKQQPDKKTGSKVESRYITAKGGLRMRDKPDTSGAKLGSIPEGTKVDLLEETGKDMTIAGATGKWSKVKWGEKTGWVFGGFLSTANKTNVKTDASIIIGKWKYEDDKTEILYEFGKDFYSESLSGKPAPDAQWQSLRDESGDINNVIKEGDSYILMGEKYRLFMIKPVNNKLYIKTYYQNKLQEGSTKVFTRQQ